MEFVCERGYDVEIDDDETVIFYKKLELFTIIYYLRPESLTLYNSDLQSIQILISAEERSKLTSPSVVIQFANAYITKTILNGDEPLALDLNVWGFIDKI